MTERRTFEQGWAAKPFKEQFPDMDESAAGRLDEINSAITTLWIGGMITYSQMTTIREKKFPKLVGQEIDKMDEVDNIEESILEFPLEISSNLHEDIFGDRNA